MSRFSRGSPQVVFRKKNGTTFTRTYHSRSSAAKAVRAWRRRRGKVVGTKLYGMGNAYLTKSRMTVRSHVQKRLF